LFVFSAALLSSAARLVSFTLTLLLLAAFSGAVFGFAEIFPSALPLFFADLACAAGLPAAALPATALAVRPGLAPTFRAADEGLLVGVPGLFPWDEGLSAEAPAPFPTDEALPVGIPVLFLTDEDFSVGPPTVSLAAGLSCPALAASC